MDIDIDLNPKYKSERLFPNSPKASMLEGSELKKHNVGVYFQNVPIDKMTGFTAIPYKDAESHGLFKIDMLPVHMLSQFDEFFESKAEIRKLTKIAPDWKLLTKKEIVEKLFHLSNHADMVTRVKPKSVAELADCLALIRPSKKHLVPKYIQDRNDPELLEELYRKESKSDFRKSHAIPYALLIVIQLHLISADLL